MWWLVRKTINISVNGSEQWQETRAVKVKELAFYRKCKTDLVDSKADAISTKKKTTESLFN